MQIISIGWLLVFGYSSLRLFAGPEDVVSPWPMLILALLLTVWHGYRILPYTPLFPKQSASTPSHLIASHRDDDRAIRLIMTNVEMQNDQYRAWVAEMGRCDPDILLAVEVDQTWMDETKAFRSAFPYQVASPRDNWYGMLLLSKLPIVAHKVRHLVQEDVPSIDALVRMRNDTIIRFVGVHPRPPEPIRDNHATARDAELTLWGKELAMERAPVIIGGDLNDVAWSRMTRLFLRTSGLLDPRRGRGFYNTFHADRWYMRFPLDHLFHSEHFTVSNIERLGFVGSDHFPILIDLRYAPFKTDEHEVLENRRFDEEEIDVRIQRAVERDRFEGEAVGGGHSKPMNGLDRGR